MADVTIHDIDPELLERLEARARVFGRSLEDEILAIIRREVPKRRDRESLRRAAHASHERFRGRVFSDSTDLIREDRDR
jgi:plasmid stability protein